MLAVWSDARTLVHALSFEAALARAEVKAGLIDVATADAIAGACDTLVLDPKDLADEIALAGTLAIPLVRHLRAAVDDTVAPTVHSGATSQDLADTVMMVQAREAQELVAVDVRRALAALAPLARKYAAVPAMGRTLLQDALPIGLGLRIAHWHAGIAQALGALDEAVAQHAMLQFGGAAGTRAGLSGKGGDVAETLAQALGLPAAPPWHARRGGVAAIATTLATLVGAIAKIARDISLLAQNGIGEVHEPQLPGRGGSSAMAHKRNPTGCQVVLAAAHRAPGLAAGVLAGMPAEQERGLGGWQAEGPALADLFLIAGGAAAAMADVAEGLEIDDAAISAHVPDDADIGESVALVAALLAPEKE